MKKISILILKCICWSPGRKFHKNISLMIWTTAILCCILIFLQKNSTPLWDLSESTKSFLIEQHKRGSWPNGGIFMFSPETS